MKWWRGPSTRRAAAFLCAVIISFPAMAQSAAGQGAGAPVSTAASVPRLEPDERAITFAAVDASPGLDWKAALELSLWASGASPAVAEQTRAAVAASVDAVRAALADGGEGDAALRARAEYVLAFMHKSLLKGYVERQTRLDTLVSTGRYNCVSSAALYVVLATAVGLDVEGVATIDHAFCSVRIGDALIDVETTSPYGFDPGSRTEFHDEFGRTTGFAYVSPRNYRDRSAISRIELLSLILTNRIVELEAAGRYAEAVGLAVDRRALLAGVREADTERELLDRMLNYGTSLAKAGRESDALAWVERARGVFGPSPRWDDFVGAAANNLLAKLIKAGRVTEARAEFVRISPTLSAPGMRNLDRLVTDAELVARIGEAKDKAATASVVASITAAAAADAIEADRAHDLTVYAQLKEAERVARAEGWAAAIAAVDEAMAASGRDRKLEDARRVYRSNRIAELHNAFAVLFNNGKYADAKIAAQRALEEFPDERRLQTDLAAVERALNAR